MRFVLAVDAEGNQLGLATRAAADGFDVRYRIDTSEHGGQCSYFHVGSDGTLARLPSKTLTSPGPNCLP